MIQNLKIQNFQSHENTEISFNKGVNVIVGSSDSGKSAIIRALRWVTTCNPRGDAIRSFWGGDTKVSITTHEGHVIERTRTNSINRYILRKNNDEELIFDAFGNNVPKEIEEILNLEEAINFQHQIDPPFLISETAGSVASHFNRMASLEKIDLGLKNTKSMQNVVNSRIDIKIEERTKLREELKVFKYLNHAEKDLVSLEEIKDIIGGKIESKETLEELTTELNELNISLVEIQTFLKSEIGVAFLIQKAKKLDVLNTQSLKLQDLINVIGNIKEQVQENVKILDAEDLLMRQIDFQKSLELKISQKNKLSLLWADLNSIKDELSLLQGLDIVLSEISTLIEKNNAFFTKEKKISQLGSIIEDINLFNERLDIEWELLRKNENTLKDYLPDICPLCNSKLK